MTTVLEPGASSRASIVRPSSAREPSIEKTFDETSAPLSRTDPSGAGMHVMGGLIVYAGLDKVVLRARHDASSDHVMLVRRRTGPAAVLGAARSTMRTSRSAS